MPLTADARLGGHFVQGHIDGVGQVVAINRADARGGDTVVRIRHPEEGRLLIVEKGSIAVDGVSLTIASCAEDWFEIMLIPHTLSVTTLGELQAGEVVNLEYDILAKHIARLMEAYQPAGSSKAPDSAPAKDLKRDE